MRLIIVSNRLPITVTEEDGKLHVNNSVGGLATGLRTFLTKQDKEYTWVGAADRQAPTIYKENHCSPVFIAKKDDDKFYGGFCNKTIWPLFHYFTEYTSYDEEQWEIYSKINESFVETVCKSVTSNEDIIWVHDYHLLLLPELLKKAMPKIPVGFFLHIPFPSFEIFRQLPDHCRKSLLVGMLGADLIGFHTYDYTQHFLTCVHRVLGHDHEMGQITVDGHIAKIDTFPMGIDFDKFHKAAVIPEETEQKLILSIDRLDYTKGISNRLQAYDLLLNKHLEWRGKVVLSVVVVPSREIVDNYQHMKKKIDELVGKINGKYGSMTWTPIVYQYKSVPFDCLVSMYRMSDVMLVTPLRDGMNLVAKEYIASRDKAGVLVLSEMAGAAQELGEAIIVNPNDIHEIADALHNALNMPKEEQAKNISTMQTRISRYNVVRWADDFIQQLDRKEKPCIKVFTRKVRDEMLSNFDKASKRLLLLDYDGTLVPIRNNIYKCAPDDKLIDIINSLSRRAMIAIVSGRPKAILQEWLGWLDVKIVAEHGAWMKDREWQLSGALSNDWKPKITSIMELWADRLPGSFVEEKEFSIAWHYRKANSDLGILRANELANHLVGFIANMPIQVLKGHKVVEVRIAGVNKGAAVHNLLQTGYDFVLAMGDDWTDEEMFKVLPDHAYSIRVGSTQTNAKYEVPSQGDVITILENLLGRV